MHVRTLGESNGHGHTGLGKGMYFVFGTLGNRSPVFGKFPDYYLRSVLNIL